MYGCRGWMVLENEKVNDRILVSRWFWWTAIKIGWVASFCNSLWNTSHCCINRNANSFRDEEWNGSTNDVLSSLCEFHKIPLRMFDWFQNWLDLGDYLPTNYLLSVDYHINLLCNCVLNSMTVADSLRIWLCAPTAENEKRQFNFHFIKIKPRTEREKTNCRAFYSYFSAYLMINKTQKQLQLCKLCVCSMFVYVRKYFECSLSMQQCDATAK